MADKTFTVQPKTGSPIIVSIPEGEWKTLGGRTEDPNVDSLDDTEAKEVLGRAKAGNPDVDLSGSTIDSESGGAKPDRVDALLGTKKSAGASAKVEANISSPTSGDTIASHPDGLWAIAAAYARLIGLGSGTHDGHSVEVTATKQWNTYERFRPQVGFGLAFQTVGKTYSLPGSTAEDAASRFRLFAPTFSQGFSVPLFADNRFAVDIVAKEKIGYTWTPPSAIGTVKGGGGKVCYDAGAGRQQCEERGSGSETNLGTDGGEVPSIGNSAEQKGLGLDVSVEAKPNFSFAIGDSALNVFLGGGAGRFQTFTGAGSRGDWYMKITGGLGVLF